MEYNIKITDLELGIDYFIPCDINLDTIEELQIKTVIFLQEMNLHRENTKIKIIKC